MIIAVTERFHDYEPKQYFLDTNLLNSTIDLDALILQEINKPQNKLNLHLDVTNWEGEGKDPQMGSHAVVENGPAEKILDLTIYFDC